MHLIAKAINSTTNKVFEKLEGNEKKFNLLMKTKAIPNLVCNYDLKFYSEEIDQEVYFPMNEDLVMAIVQRGWVIS